jgi:hypothetical protein
MSKIFYDHLIRIEEVIVELDGDSLEATEKEELISLIDDTFHHHTLNLILSQLPPEHHEKFLSRFHEAPHDPELLAFLKETIKDDVEELIRTEAAKIKKEILEDIKKSRRKKL